MRRLVMLLLAACLALPATAHAASPGQNGRIAFADVCDIATVNPDGTDKRIVSGGDCAFGDWAPSWSPDGTKFAYEHNDGEDLKIIVSNADGSGPTIIHQWGSVVGDHPTWSPDGRKMAFSGCGINVRPYPPTGGFFPPLVPGCPPYNVDDSYGDWSPDGTRIAWSSNRGGGDAEIFSVNASDGSDIQQLTNNPGNDTSPDWSPDGTRLVFYNEQTGLYKMNANGSGLTPLGSGAHPAWSPDGRKIAFHGAGLMIMNADGTGVVSTGVQIYGVPDWQPILHDAPAGAHSLHMALVPMFRQTISTSQCAARGGQNSTHGAPLAFSSCNPPGYLPNTMARLGPSSSSSVEVTGIPGDPVTSADEADLTFNVSANDVRARPGVGDYDPSANPDATLSLILRWTDTYNAPTLRAPATGSDLTYSVPVSCVASADPALGSNCSTNTTADALAPGTIFEGRRTVITLSRWWLYDSGLNATRGDGDDRMFAQSGVYIP